MTYSELLEELKNKIEQEQIFQCSKSKKGVKKCNKITKKQVKDVVDNIFDIISNNIIQGDYVLVKNFGRFELKTIKSRRYKNIITGEWSVSSGTKVPKFKYSTILKGNIAQRLSE